MEINSMEQAKKVAVVSYLTIVGCLIAIFMNQDKHPFARFHIRQSLGISLTFYALGYIVGSFDSWLITTPFYVFFFLLWIFGFTGALQGEYRIVPILGALFQKVFKSL